MNKQIALAYGIAGLAVAIALITVIDTNTGLFGRSDGQAALTSAAPEQTVEAVPTEPIATVPPTLVADQALEPPVEVVYVDEVVSAPRGERERYEDDERDDDDHHERHERHERHESGDDDD